MQILVVQGLSQNCCTLSTNRLVTPSIEIPTKRTYSVVHYHSNKHLRTSVRQIDLKLTADFVKTVACPPSENERCKKKRKKKWEECSMFGSMRSIEVNTHLQIKPFANCFCIKCVCEWMGPWTCAVPSANHSFMYHLPWTKICRFFVWIQRELCMPCRQVFSCLQNARLLPTFFAVFQNRLVNVHWMGTETMIHCVFPSCSWKIDLPRALCEPWFHVTFSKAFSLIINFSNDKFSKINFS